MVVVPMHRIQETPAQRSSFALEALCLAPGHGPRQPGHQPDADRCQGPRHQVEGLALCSLYPKRKARSMPEVTWRVLESLPWEVTKEEARGSIHHRDKRSATEYPQA
jgi:hypothetical protein